MQWFYDNLQLVIAVATVFALWLRHRQQAKAEEKDAAPPLSQQTDDIEAAERTRRVQEEIRRKIAERRGERVPRSEARPAADPAPATTWRERLEERLQEALQQPPPPPLPRPPPAVDTSAILARQQQLAEQMRQLERDRQAARRQAASVTRATSQASRPAAAINWAAELKDPRQVRRAMVLREVLGPPTGLR